MLSSKPNWDIHINKNLSTACTRNTGRPEDRKTGRPEDRKTGRPEHPAIPEHRNTRTPGIPEQPKNPGTPNLTVLFCFSITGHVKNKMSMLFVYPRKLIASSKLLRYTWVNKLHWNLVFTWPVKTKQHRQIRCSWFFPLFQGVPGCSGVPSFSTCFCPQLVQMCSYRSDWANG